MLWKVPGGKKPKKGKFNGYGTLTFSHFGGNAKLYGVRNGKCLQISKRDLRSISWYLVSYIYKIYLALSASK